MRCTQLPAQIEGLQQLSTEHKIHVVRINKNSEMTEPRTAESKRHASCIGDKIGFEPIPWEYSAERSAAL